MSQLPEPRRPDPITATIAPIVGVFRTLPPMAQVVVGLLAVLAALYFFDLVIGVVVIAVFIIGVITLTRWLANQQQK